MGVEKKFFLPSSNNILQLNELAEILYKTEVDWGIVCKLLAEIFWELKLQVTSLYCIEISKFALFSSNADMEEYIEFPSNIYNLIDDAIFLYQYPAPFCPISPDKLYTKSLNLTKQYQPSSEYKTKRERILEMYHDDYKISRIASEVKTSIRLVEKTIILSEHEKYDLTNAPALKLFDLWTEKECDSKV